LKCPTRRCVE
jgi:hypothetical protein